MAKGHPPSAVRPRRDVLLTAVLISTAFCAILYIQAVLYGQCAEPQGVATLEQLQDYLLRYSSLLDGASAQAEGIRGVHQALSQVMRNATLLPGNQAQVVALQDKLTAVHQENLVHQDKVKKLEDKVKKLEEELKEFETAKNQLKALEQQSQDAKQQANQLAQQAQDAKQQVQQLTQQKEQLEKDKQELQKKRQQAGSSASSNDTLAAEAEVAAAKIKALSIAGEQCFPVKDHEFWADPILVWGYEHRAVDAAECCAACHAQRRLVERGGTEQGRNGSACNIWAFCGDREHCQGRFGECWLKHEKDLKPPPALPPRTQQAAGWISGAVYDNDTHLEQYANYALVFHTKLGDITMTLLPDLAPASVRELRRVTALLAPYGGYCQNCRIYRPETGFLVQGVIEAPGVYPATPRHPNPPQKMTMEKGLVCWAGGGGGPHWFVNMIDQSGFKDDHLCFAKAQDLTVFDKILKLPLKEKAKPSDMNGLVEPVFYNITLKQLAAGSTSGTQEDR